MLCGGGNFCHVPKFVELIVFVDLCVHVLIRLYYCANLLSKYPGEYIRLINTLFSL